MPEPEVALQRGGGIRNNNLLLDGVTAGTPKDFTALNTFQIAPFSDFLSIVSDVKRTVFKQILGRAVSAMPAAQGFFAKVAGFSFTYDPSGTAQVQDNEGNILSPGFRVVDVMPEDRTMIVSGGMVVDGPDLAVATIAFLARGGDGYPLDQEQGFEPVGVSYQQALYDYVVQELAGADIGRRLRGRWRRPHPSGALGSRFPRHTDVPPCSTAIRR